MTMALFAIILSMVRAPRIFTVVRIGFCYLLKHCKVFADCRSVNKSSGTGFTLVGFCASKQHMTRAIVIFRLI